MTTLTNLIAALSLITLPTVAAANPQGDAIERMECLVGTWKATGTMTMGKDTTKVAATWTCKRTSAKFGVLCNLKVTGIPGMTYEETDLFGYDPSSKTYHWFAVTNGGETHDHVAKAEDSPKVQWVYTGTQEGKPLKEVIDWAFSGKGKLADTLALRSETFVDGASVAVLEVKARK